MPGDNIYSFSRLSTFEQCPYQYYLNYVLPKEERPPKEDNAFSLYGSFVHELLEKYSLGELASWDLLQIYEDEFDLRVNKDFPPNAYADLRESYFNDGYAFLESFDGFDEEYETLGVEQKFVCDFGDFKLQGFIDLILRDRKTGGIIVQDWKSKSKFANKKEQAHYARQPALYSKYIYETYGVFPTILRFYMFRKGTIVDIPFSEKIYNEAINWASNIVKKIEATDSWYPVKDSWMCTQLCDFRHSCQFADEVREELIEKGEVI